ncbi:MAG: ROK family protein [Verrucomicrobiales bacterium]|nr:ROK family protein [Verrucomicrobiales bacterium]
MMANNNTDPETPLLGGIEAGGTKIVCAIASEPSEPLFEESFPTTTPEETTGKIIEFFEKAAQTHGPVASLGIGTFGPADIHPRSPGYGSILTTPKKGWSHYSIVQSIRDGLGTGIPIAFDTDVNAAAVGEAEYGAGRNHRFIAYVTVGTGIGGGFLQDGQILKGRMHPEIGHIPVPDYDAAYGKSTNVCPFHDSCLEGRAAGPSLAARWDIPGQDLPDDHEAWDLEAKYLAAGCISLTASWSPDTIIIGGGVSSKYGLIDRIRAAFADLSGDYWALPPLEIYLQNPALGQKAGIVGSLCLAQRMLQKPEN